MFNNQIELSFRSTKYIFVNLRVYSKRNHFLPSVTPPDSGEEQAPSRGLDEGGNLSCGSQVKSFSSGRHLDLIEIDEFFSKRWFNDTDGRKEKWKPK